MHRYRDAIVYDMSRGGDKKDIPGPYDRTMFGAYVLFPYSDEEKYKEHDFYKSIGTVNIGGLPFLPSATNMVRDFLEEPIFMDRFRYGGIIWDLIAVLFHWILKELIVKSR